MGNCSSDFEALLKRIFKRKITSAKIAKICWQITIAAWMQPLQYDLLSAAKDNSITHAAAAPSNLDAANTMRSAETELQNAKELSATVSEIAAPNRISTPKQKKDDFAALFKRIFTKPKLPKSADKSLSQPGCSYSNTIYNLQLQKTIVLRMQPRHQATLTQPFQCDLQPQLQETHRNMHTGTTIAVAKHIEGTKRPQPQPPHTRGTFHRRLQPLYTEKHKVLCSGFLPITHSMQHSCSHSNAICNHSFKKCIELRAQEQPLLQNT